MINQAITVIMLGIACLYCTVGFFYGLERSYPFALMSFCYGIAGIAFWYAGLK